MQILTTILYKMKHYKYWRVIPFTTLVLIPFIKIYYTSALFFTTWMLIFLMKRNYSKKISSTEIENIAIGIGKKNELEKLYKDLIKKVHPDKNSNRSELAKEYSEKINNHRYNYNEMKKLSEEIEQVFKL